MRLWTFLYDTLDFTGLTLEVNSVLKLNCISFFRELQYRLGFAGFGRQSCEFILVQNLPAAVFVNTDQLDDLKRLKKVT